MNQTDSRSTTMAIRPEKQKIPERLRERALQLLVERIAKKGNDLSKTMKRCHELTSKWFDRPCTNEELTLLVPAMYAKATQSGIGTRDEDRPSINSDGATPESESHLSRLERMSVDAPACYGAASVFCHESTACNSCQAFSACDDECLVTLEKIKDRVNVTAIMKRHADGRMRLGRPTTVPTTHLTVTAARSPISSPAPTDPSLDDEGFNEAKAVIDKAKVAAASEAAAPIALTPAPDLPIAASATTPHAASVSTAAPTISPTSFAPSATTADEACEDYDFPARDVDDDSSKTNAALAERLVFLVQHAKAPDDYLKIRTEYCELAILLNQRKLWAPGFRPEVKIPWNPKARKPVHKVIHRDRLVIDFHWLHTTGKGNKVRTDEVRWRPIFNHKEPFPFDLAIEFSMREVKSDYRAENILGLSPRRQFQTATLRGQSVLDQIKAIEKYQRVDGRLIPSYMQTVRAVVARWCEIDGRLEKHRDKYIAHAQAEALLAITSPSWKEVAELGGLIQGVAPLGEKTVSDFMKKLGARMAKSTPPRKLV